MAHRCQHFENVISLSGSPLQVDLGDHSMAAKVCAGTLPGQGRLQFPGLPLESVEFRV